MNTNYKSILSKKWQLQVLLAIGLFFVLPAFAQPGKLDLSFGNGGVVSTNGDNTLSFGWAVAIQPDGKIVTVGRGGTRSFAVARYNPNGSLDISFGLNGIVLTSIGSVYDSAYGVAIQGDGKIVVAGTTHLANAGGYIFAVVRYNTNGSLDTSFNGTGIVTTSVGGYSSDFANSVALQTDGKIVVAGYGYNSSNADFALVRYKTDGSLDLSFNGGIVITPVGTSFDLASSVSIQPDGKIVAAGRAGSSPALVRYTTFGQLDTSFNGTGIVTTSFGNGFSGSIRGLAIQWDGKLVVAGRIANSSNHPAFAFARYYPNGKLDTSFGGTGKIIIPVGDNYGGYANSIAIQPDGKIVAAGKIDERVAVVRLNSNGSLDTTFNGNGIVSTPAAYNAAATVAIQADGKIVAAGGDDNEGIDFVMVRYQGGPFRVNGKIAFTSDRDGNMEIYVMNNDGTHQVRLTNNTDLDCLPTYSPDGRKIVFVNKKDSDVYIKVMNADGTNQTVVTPITSSSYLSVSPWHETRSLSWSPDGRKIVFDDAGVIVTINIDGSNRTNLTNNAGSDFSPAWSPDGSRILFVNTRNFGWHRLNTMNSDGSDVRALPWVDLSSDRSPEWSPTGSHITFVVEAEEGLPILYTADADGANRRIFDGTGWGSNHRKRPKWSPDGTKLVFHKWEYLGDDCEIYLKNMSGGGVTQLTNTTGHNFQPTWQQARIRQILPAQAETGSQR